MRFAVRTNNFEKVQEAVECLTAVVHGYETDELYLTIYRVQTHNPDHIDIFVRDEKTFLHDIVATVNVTMSDEDILSHLQAYVSGHFAGCHAGAIDTKNQIKKLLDINC